jgi:hypothetical protein
VVTVSISCAVVVPLALGFSVFSISARR